MYIIVCFKGPSLLNHYLHRHENSYAFRNRFLMPKYKVSFKSVVKLRERDFLYLYKFMIR